MRKNTCECTATQYCIWHAQLARAAGIALPAAMLPRVPFTLPSDAPEGQLQGEIQKLCTQLGLLFFHVHDARKSAPGWPDCAIIHPEGGPLYLWELKNATAEPEPNQERWLRALERATRVDVQVYRPADLPLIAERLTQRR
jgi:hypothetical protein